MSHIISVLVSLTLVTEMSDSILRPVYASDPEFLALQALLKKHEALMSDLSAYGSSIQALKEQAQACRVSLLSSC